MDECMSVWPEVGESNFPGSSSALLQQLVKFFKAFAKKGKGKNENLEYVVFSFYLLHAAVEDFVVIYRFRRDNCQ